MHRTQKNTRNLHVFYPLYLRTRRIRRDWRRINFQILYNSPSMMKEEKAKSIRTRYMWNKPLAFLPLLLAISTIYFLKLAIMKQNGFV